MSKTVFVRGIRGATTVYTNTQQIIMKETKILIQQMMDKNAVTKEDIASIFFSVTYDLDAAFPAAAARELGMIYTPLLCLNEIKISGSLEKCIRVLMHVNTIFTQAEINHIYLNEAGVLRPEFAQ